MLCTYAKLLVLASLVLGAAIAPTAPEESAAQSAGVERCELQQVNGTPVMLMDGRRVAPLIFFFNSEATSIEAKRRNWEPQVEMSAGAGVHVYSMGMHPPSPEQGMERAMDIIKAAVEPFIAADPQAMFIPRMNVTPSAAWLAAHPDDQMVFADGTRGYEAIASEAWRKAASERLAEFVRFVEASPYGRRFVGYHIAGQNSGEWFPEAYREKGPDVGPANTAGFRRWLKSQYADDAALRQAWGNPQVTLETAAVPVGESGRFPIHNVGPGTLFEAFYRLPAERNWVDYSQYTSELTATLLVELSGVVKQATNRRKLTVLFYGYNMDLPASIGGHYDLMRLLESPEVDVLASPVAYVERLRGESTGFMAPVDSIAAHGKLWVIENDMRTHLWTPAHQPPEIANDPQFIAEQSFLARPRDGAETVELLRRDWAAMVAHRCGTWWMDLAAVGAYRDPAIWKMIGELRPSYEKLYENPFPFRPGVALIVDDASRHYEKSDWDLGAQLFSNLRHQLDLTGASVGFYLLEDFLAGRVPPCKAYVFANAVRLDEQRVNALRERLEREGATAIWLYAPGWIGDAGTSIEQSRRLTGIELEQKDGMLGSHSETGEGDALAWGLQVRGLDEGKTFTMSPRLVVKDAAARPIGRYFADGEVSAAVKAQGRAKHVFLGDINVTTALLRRVLREAGVHLWTDAGAAVHTDGAFLSVHVAETGVYPIYLPDGVSLEGIEEIALGRAGNARARTVFVPFGRSQTRFFTIHSEQ